MATVEERMKILKMIQEGKITAEQGVQLLDAMDAGAQRAKPGIPTPPAPPAGPGRGSHWFRVLVTDTNTGKTRVNVRLPVGLVSAGMKMGARFSPQVERLDPQQLMEFLNSGETGKIIDVVDEDDGEHVEVFIE
jgi:hypothetical protein